MRKIILSIVIIICLCYYLTVIKIYKDSYTPGVFITTRHDRGNGLQLAFFRCRGDYVAGFWFHRCEWRCDYAIGIDPACNIHLQTPKK